jgi:hypothetical protein
VIATLSIGATSARRQTATTLLVSHPKWHPVQRSASPFTVT